MKTYTVTVREIYNCYMEIEANSPEEAIRKVADHADGIEVDLQYVDTLDPSTWDVIENPEPEAQ